MRQDPTGMISRRPKVAVRRTQAPPAMNMLTPTLMITGLLIAWAIITTM
jgi:hypothetical protein